MDSITTLYFKNYIVKQTKATYLQAAKKHGRICRSDSLIMASSRGAFKIKVPAALSPYRQWAFKIKTPVALSSVTINES